MRNIKLQQENGYALLLTLIVLIIMTIFLIFVFQNSSLNLLVSKNALDQPIALQNANACEQHNTRKILNLDISGMKIDDANNGNTDIQCQASVPTPIEQNGILAGFSAAIKSNSYRFQTTAQAQRGTNISTMTDVRIVFNANQLYE